MSEIVPAIAVDNFFSLGAMFGIDRAETTEAKQFTTRFNASGNYLCSREHDLITNYVNDFNHCAPTNSVITDLGAILTAFGDVANSKLVTNLELTFESGVGATGSITGHQHASNPHVAETLRTADVSGVLTVSSPYGVPTVLTVAGDCSPTRATITFDIEHVDKPGADGTHFLAQNIRCHVTASIDYEGTVTGTTAGDWLNILVTTSEQNSDTPTSSISCEQWVDLA